MSNINNYPLEAFQINDEDFYDVDYWNGLAFETRKISGATLKAVIGAAASNIYNSDGALLGNRFLSLDTFDLFISDLAGSTKFDGGNLIEVKANSGEEALIKLLAGNGEKRGISFLDQNSDRWEFIAEGLESGANSGTNFIIYRYDDAGILLGKSFEINRASGAIRFNDEYTFPIADGNPGESLQTDGAGNLSFQPSAADHINLASSQWSKTLPAPVDLPNGAIANGFTFFDNALDKLTNGTTPYYEFNIDFGITISLSGSSGSANINVNGVDYLATYSVSLFQTALNWVNANESALNTLGIMVFALGSGADGRIRFGSANESLLNAISISNISTDLSGIIANEFTGLANAAGDHIIVPYIGTEIDTQRLLHTIRANFNLSTGSIQYAELGLFRYENDSIIGSGIQIQRNPDVTGTQLVLETYTANQNDAFVTGGFYIALINNSGVTLSFEGNAGILIQTIFQKPTLF